MAQLHAVLEQPQHAIVAREGGCLGPADVALRHEGVERLERAALADAVVGEPVDELQQLDGELDVADAARAELELVRHVGRGDVLGDPLAHPLHAVDEVLARGARPDLRLHRRGVGPAERVVAGDRTRLEQRLELPALRPPVVVRQVRVERAHQRALLALRAQVGVDLPQRRLDLDARDAAHRLHGEAGGDVDDAALAELLEGVVVSARRRRSRRRR